MGLGLFACQREAWLGFPENLKGFGGEELMIHEKFRQAGRKTLCLPFLRWWHLFRGNDEPAPYPLTIDDRFRNYLIWHRHLGLDEGELIERFNARLPSRRADRIVQTVGELTIKRFDPETVADPTKLLDPATLAGRFEIARREKSDINEHCDALKELASRCETVVEFGTRHAVSTVALLAGQPKQFISVDVNPSAEAEELRALAGSTNYDFVVGSSLEIPPVQCDMLFIDTIHTKNQVAVELDRHAAGVRKYLVFHDTATFGKIGEDGGPGIMEAIRDFLKEKNNDEWIVLDSTDRNNGLLILSRDPADRRPLPETTEQVGNFLKAAGRYILNKGAKVSGEQLQERLETCLMCRHRNGQRCAECGCPIARKAPQIGEDCRLGLWPKLNVIEHFAPDQIEQPAEQPAGQLTEQSAEQTEPQGTTEMPSDKPNESNDCDHSGTIESRVDFSTERDQDGSPVSYTVKTKCRCTACGQRWSTAIAEVTAI
jgi:predicted O-methyltransferase YrrM